MQIKELSKAIKDRRLSSNISFDVYNVCIMFLLKVLNVNVKRITKKLIKHRTKQACYIAK